MAPIEIRRSRVVTTGKGFLADVGMVARMGSGTEFGVSSIIGGDDRTTDSAVKSGATASVSWISGLVWIG